MSNGGMVVAEQTVFSLQPKNLDEAMKFADLIAKSSLVPRNYQGKPGDIIIAIQIGQEVGLKPLQALQYIAVVNGRPSLYGDAPLALVRRSKLIEDFREDFDAATMTATCQAKRSGQPSPITRTYSKTDAEKAKLWGKDGVWQTNPRRMLQLRARAFVLRDGFADVLLGLAIGEEQEDVVEAETTALPEPPRIEPPKRLSQTTGEQAASNTTASPPDPYTTHHAKSDGQCGECQETIPVGETYYFDKTTNRVRCDACYEVEMKF